MPRKPRFFVPNVPTHVVQRGNNRDPIFFMDCDYEKYLEILENGAKEYMCEVHAYVLMTNHVHILLSPKEKDGVSLLMQYIGRYYVPYINREYGRCGTLWEGRFKSSLIQDEQYLLRCMRYIELNPVRAGMVDNPKDYLWSSYKRNAYGKPDELVTAHEVYTSISNEPVQQRKAYRALVKKVTPERELADIRAALQTGTPLGNEMFKQKVEKELKVKVGYATRGRPRSK